MPPQKHRRPPQACPAFGAAAGPPALGAENRGEPGQHEGPRSGLPGGIGAQPPSQPSPLQPKRTLPVTPPSVHLKGAA